jgi:carbonic anhydrase/acetyltransferase-like protein (isoleucine patch superfamily)
MSFSNSYPRLGRDVFIAESAHVIGDVEIGDESSIWFGAVVRGDVNHIRIGKRTNIQDCSVLHVTSGQWPLIIGDNVTAGHRVVLHGCTIGDNVIVGIGAVVLDGAVVESTSIIGAGSVVAPGTTVPSGTLVMGVPARVKRELKPEEIERIAMSANNYVKYSKSYSASR